MNWRGAEALPAPLHRHSLDLHRRRRALGHVPSDCFPPRPSRWLSFWLCVSRRLRRRPLQSTWTRHPGRCAHEDLSSILETLDCRRQPESPFGTLELGETRFSRAFAGHSRLPLPFILHCFVSAGDDHCDQAATSRLASFSGFNNSALAASSH